MVSKVSNSCFNEFTNCLEMESSFNLLTKEPRGTGLEDVEAAPAGIFMGGFLASLLLAPVVVSAALLGVPDSALKRSSAIARSNSLEDFAINSFTMDKVFKVP